MQGLSYKDIFQAGKSVAGIRSVQPVAEIVAAYAAALPGSSGDGASAPYRRD